MIWLQIAMRYAVLTCIVTAFSAMSMNAQTASNPCAPVGADSGCGIILTIVDIGTGANPCPSAQCVTVTNTGQPPYDDIEDTLIGVVNNSKIPISSIVLTSPAGLPAFAFDGDGICGPSPNTGMPYVPAPPCTWPAPTTYEGPVLDAKGSTIGAVSFSNISADFTTGTVTFNPPIPAQGGLSYFSLEESLASATTCTSILNNSVTHALTNGGTGITARFTSNANLADTLAQAANACGFTDWDWQQTITSLPCGTFFEAGNSTPLKAPFNDPPLKGYTYQMPPNAVQVPVYWNPFTAAGTLTNPGGQLLSLADHRTLTGFSMDFGDSPALGCLSGSSNGTGNKVGFTTHLAGLVGAGPGFGVQDTGVGFSWTTTFNGTSGGISVLNSPAPVDPGSGTGGITITAVSNTSSYQFPKGVGVTAINGISVSSSAAPPVLLGQGQIAVTASGLAYSRATQTFSGTIVITNASNSTISGPLQIVLDTLTPGVDLVNASGAFGGWSYITVPSVSSLTPGQSASVTVVFKNSGNATINFSPVVYSGSFS